MLESESKGNNIAEKKRKISERYKGANLDEIEVISAIEEADFYSDESPKRVAVYARVSTDNLQQTSSYELQKNYYTDFVSQHPNWTLVEIYADEGISGTSLKHRDSFNRMINDCYAGKIDLIVTKSVSRFARNLVDCIDYVRKLKALEPSVGVFFETERIYSLNGNTEMSLSFMATLAQEESHNKSEIMNVSVEMRFSHGIFLTPAPYGYDQDEDGNLVINDEEAQIVRLIFFDFLYGYTCSQIANLLTSLNIKTKTNKDVWSPTTILNMLKNERYCGEVLARKTYTPNYLDHKSKKNSGQRNQYRQVDHHDKIIEPCDFVAVQKIIRIAKTCSPGYLPKLHVIKDGVLKGYVKVHPKWLFKPDDYMDASASVYKDDIPFEPSEESEIEVKEGDLDLRGYNVARSQLFPASSAASVTFSSKTISFSSLSIRKLGDIQNVEILIHPTKKTMVVRKAESDEKNSIVWAAKRKGKLVPKSIGGAPFLAFIYELMHWDTDFRFRINGVRKQNGETSILLFDLRDTEVFIPDVNENTSERRIIVAYPMSWASSFGTEYYRHAQLEEVFSLVNTPSKHLQDSGVPFNTDEEDIRMPNKAILKENISSIVRELRQETV